MNSRYELADRGSPGDGACDDCGGPPNNPDDGGLRCACGSLLARHVPGGVELKCRRCKRTVVIRVKKEIAD